MRLKNVFFIIFILIIFNPAFAVQQGGIQYSVPVDYSLIDEQKLNMEAETLYNRYLKTDDLNQQKILLRQLLSEYSILGNIDNSNPLYFTRLGIIFDKLGNDRFAKANFSRGSNIDSNYSYAFYSFGNYFFDRKEYKKALQEYKKAFDTGYNNNSDTLLKMGKIYEKLGDYNSALIYYKKANSLNNTTELQAKIDLLEVLLNNNRLYDKSRNKGRKE